ncbi:MAG: hypothetical protein EA351_13525 [Gemmatimonadales bacterium]|nr:MAG: hypothetical protein EA351_13525 [Gemmatimonadales bacterium]
MTLSPSTRAWPPVPLAIAGLFSMTSGCTLGSDDPRTMEYEVTLHAEREIALEETDEAYVAGIGSGTTIDFRNDGHLAVADRMERRVLFFDDAGDLLGMFGREGEGPGEFRHILGIAWDERDRLWVSDNSGRITVIDATFAMDTLFEMGADTDYARRLGSSRGTMLVEEHRFPPSGAAIRAYDLDGRPGPMLMAVPEEGGRPYVLGEFHASSFPLGDTVLLASSVNYPLLKVQADGTPLATFGTRPPSIGTMTFPAAGEFAGSRQILGAEWQRSFGTVRAIWAVHDSLIVVEHTRRHPEAGGIPPWHYWIDVYDRWSMEKLAEDVSPPGFVVGVHDDLLWLLTGTPLTSEPVGGPWTVTGFRVGLEPTADAASR